MCIRDRRTSKRGKLHIEIIEGFTWMWRQPFIRAMTLLMGSSALILPGSVLIVIVFAQQQHAPPFIIGLIFAAGGIGAILGSLLAPLIHKRLSVGQSILSVRWAFVLLWTLYALAPFPLVLGAIEFGFGVADPIEDVAYFSYRLMLIPDALKGRVISACRLFPGTTRPIGLVLTGILIQRFGVTTTAVVFWICLALMTLIATIDSSIRKAGA